MSMKNEEYQIQVAVVNYLSYQYPDVLFNADCGGQRYGEGIQAIMRGKRMKASGHKKGFPDLAIFEPRGKYHGLFIELKVDKNGVLSYEQDDWLVELDKRGYYSVCCRGFESAKKCIDLYLK